MRGRLLRCSYVSYVSGTAKTKPIVGAQGALLAKGRKVPKEDLSMWLSIPGPTAVEQRLNILAIALSLEATFVVLPVAGGSRFHIFGKWGAHRSLFIVEYPAYCGISSASQRISLGTVCTPLVIAPASDVRHRRELANGHPFTLSADAGELSGAMHKSPSSFSFRWVALAKKCRSTCLPRRSSTRNCRLRPARR